MNSAACFSFENRWVDVTARWILGGVFILAAYPKILDPAAFAKIIYGYALFPDVSINLIAIWLPFLEMTAGAALILGILPRTAALIVNILLAFFVIIITVNLVRGHEFDCGCFAVKSMDAAVSSPISLLGRDALFLLLAFRVYLHRGGRLLVLNLRNS